MSAFLGSIENRMAVQQALKSEGYYHGEIDGHLGPLSSQAISDYRTANRMDRAGEPVVDRELVERLGIKSTPTRKPGFFEVLALIFTLSNLKKGQPMKWDTVQQVIRIALYSGGSYIFGQQVADGNLYQAAVGGALAVGAFVWWFFFERDRVAKS